MIEAIAGMPEDEFSPSQISTIRNHPIEYIDNSANDNLQEAKY